MLQVLSMMNEELINCNIGFIWFKLAKLLAFDKKLHFYKTQNKQGRYRNIVKHAISKKL